MLAGLDLEQPQERRLVILLGLSHTSTVIEELRAAADALNRGDPEPFVSLFAEDAEWRGISSGRLWWKHTPS